MKIILKDFGGFLSSKDLGHRIALSILDSIRKEPENNVILDFSGVQSVHRNFCEELLSIVFSGIGFEEFRKKVVLQNQSAVVKFVFDAVVAQKKDTSIKGIDNVLGSPIQTVHVERKEEESEKKSEAEKPVTPVEKRVDEPAVIPSPVEEVANKDVVENELKTEEPAVKKVVEKKVERQKGESKKSVRKPAEKKTISKGAVSPKSKKETSSKKSSSKAKTTTAKRPVSKKKK